MTDRTFTDSASNAFRSGERPRSASADVDVEAVQASLPEASERNRPVAYAAGLPLYGISRLAYRSMQNAMHGLAQLSDDRSRAWELLDEMLEAPLALPYVMVTGPRWNTHALIASAGPFEVERRLEIDTSTLQGMNWYVVLHRLPDNTCVQWAGHSTGAHESPLTFRVEPGRYSLLARLYPSDAHGGLPEVSVDGGAATVPPRTVGPVDLPQSSEQFGRRSLLYDLLHYHVFFALHHAHRFDQDVIQRQYLPVGNPGTSFAYGAVTPGETITVRWSRSLHQTNALFLTAYNRSSFPIYSAPLVSSAGESTHHEIATTGFDEAATFLLRIVPRPSASEVRHERAGSIRATSASPGLSTLASALSIRTEPAPAAARTVPSLHEQAGRKER